ncbi:hypothetical protein AB1Y20_018124 [Prymnesium parvum]|uniref:RNA polymerase I-specific transcription initiation factor RRN3 n=1 Tax=Prymnesium parvum TaxID=97485 RepID=A0AB34JML3_PRYPA
MLPQEAARAEATPPRATNALVAASSLHSVEHRLRSGHQTALRQELASASVVAACQMLHAFSLCASSIHADMHLELVETILTLPWQTNVQLASAVCEFVQDLITASTPFVRMCICALVESFVLPEDQAPDDSREMESGSSVQEQICQHVHGALHGILKVCPLASSHLYDAVKELFPHSRRNTKCHSHFLANTLKLLTYAPALRPRAIHLIIERFVDLDVQIALQQRLLEEAVEEDADSIFEVELGDTTAEEIAKMRLNAEKLDEMMVMMFEFINLTCSSGTRALGSPGSVSSPSAQPAGLQLFEALISAFRSSVMQTYKCRSTQFVMFFCCSYDLGFARAFMRLLLQQVEADLVHTEERAACAAYLSSFLARARYLPIGEVLHTVRQMVSWAHEYQLLAAARLQGQAASLDVQLHGVFYAVVQGVLYVLCYKHELLFTDECLAAREDIGAALQPILLCELNPLKFCLDNVVVEFERLQLCDCAHVVAANERLAIGSRSASGTANRLEDFFPFDPIQLKRCAKLISPLYQTWQPPAGFDSEPRDSACSLEASSCSSHDAASDSLARSLQAMSVTPLSGDDASLEVHMRKRLAENIHMFRSDIAAARAGA